MGTVHYLAPRLGDIGEDQREYEFEPMPLSTPVEEPNVAPDTVPDRESVPA